MTISDHVIPENPCKPIITRVFEYEGGSLRYPKEGVIWMTTYADSKELSHKIIAKFGPECFTPDGDWDETVLEMIKQVTVGKVSV